MDFTTIDAAEWLWWATAFSIAMLVATVFAMPWVLKRLPADYFSREHRRDWGDSRGAPVAVALIAMIKNLLGATLILLGVLLLFMPGQGLLTLLAGVMLMNFPGKYRLERWLVGRKGVLKSLNWLRQRRNMPPFEAPPQNHGASQQ